jgi:molecular chaperone Hsp33
MWSEDGAQGDKKRRKVLLPSQQPEGQAREMMRQAMAAATLHLARHPPEEFDAFTLNIKDPPLNVFLAGDNDGYHVTGRVFTSGVKTVESSRLFLESQRPRHEPQRSVVNVEGIDVLRIFEQFYARSVQVPSRLFELEPGRFALVQGMPRADRAWLEGMDTDEARALLAEELEPIEQRSYTFHCGCHPHRILQVVHAAYDGKADPLFLGDDRVEVQCPRCGRSWWLTREDFELGPGKVGVS